MNLYAKLIFENINNEENLLKIEDAASQAIDYCAEHYEHAVSETFLDINGNLQLVFVEGQELDSVDIQESVESAREMFAEKFSDIIKMEYSEL